MLRELSGYISIGQTDEALGWTDAEKGVITVAEIHIYVSRPAEKEGETLEALEETLRKLEHVSDVAANTPGNVVAVSFEGGQAQQEEIERAVEEAGYEISRLSVRSTFSEESNLWDI